MKNVISLVMVVWWMHGLVVANGFWWTLACIFPPIAWYTSMEWFVKTFLVGC